MSDLVRALDDVIITAKCIECRDEFTGQIGVHMITVLGSPYLELVVIELKRNEHHPIARVSIFDVPVAPRAPMQATGSA